MRTIVIELPDDIAQELDFLVDDAGHYSDWNQQHPDDPANASDVVGALVDMLYKRVKDYHLEGPHLVPLTNPNWGRVL